MRERSSDTSEVHLRNGDIDRVGRPNNAEEAGDEVLVRRGRVYA